MTPPATENGKIALIADIHANDIAFERVVDEINREGIERVVCLGDVAGTGPQPRETLERLRSLDPRVVMGNVDAFLLKPTVSSNDEFMRKIEEVDSWCVGQLLPEDLDYVRSFEPTVELSLHEGARLVCYHGSPRSFDDRIVPTTPDAEVEELFLGLDLDIAAGGHTHFQMLRRVGDVTVVNPGSVGLAYDRTHPARDVRLAPWAEYVVLEANVRRASIEFRRTSFDVDALVSAIERSGMPHADWLVSEWLG
jgi:putative phosphoesterase